VLIRTGIPLFIVFMSAILPDVNLLLSLVTGSICGTIILGLPIVFYRKAYISKPSKKDRTRIMMFGYFILVSAIVIGVLGTCQNIVFLLSDETPDELVE